LLYVPIVTKTTKAKVSRMERKKDRKIKRGSFRERERVIERER